MKFRALCWLVLCAPACVTLPPEAKFVFTTADERADAKAAVDGLGLGEAVSDAADTDDTVPDADPDVADAAEDVPDAAVDVPEAADEVPGAAAEVPDVAQDASVDAPDAANEVDGAVPVVAEVSIEVQQDVPDAPDAVDATPKCSPAQCDDGNQCTTDGCNLKTDACSHTPLDGLGCNGDGNGCTENDACKGDVCVAGKAKVCPAVKDVCLQAVCLSASPTQATCGSEPAKAGGTCDDASACTTGDKCDGKGACVGKAGDCIGTACQIANCDPSDGSCSKKKKAEGSVCDDGEVCTVVDGCVNGACKGSQDACAEERIDVGVPGGYGVSVVAVGFGRYVAQWLGSGSGENTARWTDVDGSRENEETKIASPGTGLQGGGAASPGRTLAVTAAGATLLAGFGASSVNVPLGGVIGYGDGTLGPVTATLFDASGEKAIGPTSVFSLHMNLKNQGNCLSLTAHAAVKSLRYQVLAFGDGTFATLVTWIGAPDGKCPLLAVQSPAAGKLKFIPSTAQLVTGGASDLLVSDQAMGFDARVVPDSTDRIAVAWSTKADLRAALYSKTGEAPGAGPIVVATGAFDNARVLPFDDGSFVAVWEDKSADGSGYGLFQRKISDTGTPLALASPVNTATTGNQRLGEVAPLQAGGWVVVWHDAQGDGQGDGIKARRFLADGAPNGSEFTVNTLIAGSQVHPSVASFDDGGFLIAWRDDKSAVWTRRFDKNAKALPGAVERPLAQDPAGSQTQPKVATLGGAVLTVWQTVVAGQDPDVRIRLLDAKGATLLAETSVSTAAPVHASSPAVAAGANRFTVAWIAGSATGQKVRLRSFDAKGLPLGSDVEATPSGLFQAQPAVAVAADGGALVAWTVGGADIEAQRFDAKGKAVDAPFHLPKDDPTGKHSEPVLAATTGGFVAGWRGPGSTADMVVLQRLDSGGQPVGTETPAAATPVKQQGLALAAQGAQLLACWQEWQAGGASNWNVVCRYFTAATLAPIGPEFSPHLASPLDQMTPTVAFAGEVAAVAWTTSGLDGSGQAIQAAWLGPAGKLLAPRVTVNRTRTGNQFAPAVAALPGGKAAFVWQSSGQETAEDLGGVHLRVLTGP